MKRVSWCSAAIAIALGVAGCHQQASKEDRNSAAIRTRFGSAKISWVIARNVNGSEVTCGYESHGSMRQPFIARAGRVWQDTDLAQGQFEKLEDELCGPDWVKPLPPVPAPS